MLHRHATPTQGPASSGLARRGPARYRGAVGEDVMTEPTRTPAVRDLSSRDDLEVVLRDFYGTATVDPLLGPVFTDVAHMDLEQHLPVITDFWTKVLFDVGTYNGRAMEVHRRLHARSPLTAAHFEVWLRLWVEAVDRSFTGPVADQAKAHAHRMAGVFLRELTEPRRVLRPLPLVGRSS